MYSVVIPTRTLANIGPCIAAIQANEPNLPLSSIVVVDDDETGKVQRFCESHGATRILGAKPFVFPRAINMGVKAAIAVDPDVEGFVLVNDDSLLESNGGFTLLHESVKAHPEIGILGAVTDLTGQPLQRPRGIGLRVVPHIAFVCCYVPRSTFENVQWMDTRYCVDYGCCDLDLCQAVTRAGLNVAVHDSCFVNHSTLTSSFRGDPQTPRSFQQNYALYKEKWGVTA